MKLRSFLEEVVALELAAAHYYRTLASMTTDPELKALWQAMEDDEQTHAATIEAMERHVDRTEDIEIDKKALHYDDLQELAAAVSKVMEEVSTYNLKQMFETALFLESAELNSVYRHLLHLEEFEIPEYIKKIDSSHISHKDRLSDGFRKFLFDEELVEKFNTFVEASQKENAKK